MLFTDHESDVGGCFMDLERMYSIEPNSYEATERVIYQMLNVSIRSKRC